MNDLDIQVIAEQVKNLSNRIDIGFQDIKDLIRSGAQSLEKHIDEDKETHKEIDTKLATLTLENNNLKIELARVKERWLLMSGLITITATCLVESVLHFVIK